MLRTTNVFAFEIIQPYLLFLKTLNNTQKELLRCLYIDIRTHTFSIYNLLPTNALVSLKILRMVYLMVREVGVDAFFSTEFEANTWILERYLGHSIINLRLLKGLGEVFVVLPGYHSSSEAEETPTHKNHPHEGIVRRREHTRIIEQMFLDPEGAKTRAQEIVMRREYDMENRRAQRQGRRG